MSSSSGKIRRYRREELVDVESRWGWMRGFYMRRQGKLHRVYVCDRECVILFTDNRVRPARHRVAIETMAKTGRRKDPPRSRWSCSCGAGEKQLTTPSAAHAAADKHFEEGMKQ